VVRAASLAKIPWLLHGFSTRDGGFSKIYGGNTLNLGFTADDTRTAVERNRSKFCSAVFNAGIGRKPERSGRWKLVTLRQLHSDIIDCVSQVPEGPLAGDGLITSTPTLILAVLTADCLPVILADTRRHAVGIFHAGWRGTLKRILEKGLGDMRRCFGTKPPDVRAAIGPGIRGCCYQVGPEIKAAFESQFSYGGELFRETKERDAIHEKYPLLFLSARPPGHSPLPVQIFLDLAEANRRQLLEAGVRANNISDLGLCTSCSVDRFFSHRAEKGITGRMMAVVGIK